MPCWTPALQAKQSIAANLFIYSTVFYTFSQFPTLIYNLEFSSATNSFFVPLFTLNRPALVFSIVWICTTFQTEKIFRKVCICSFSNLSDSWNGCLQNKQFFNQFMVFSFEILELRETFFLLVFGCLLRWHKISPCLAEHLRCKQNNQSQPINLYILRFSIRCHNFPHKGATSEHPLPQHLRCKQNNQSRPI